ncbi:tripartite tricarboxylate transporter TctB family protein [Marinobacterium arenosum]|uniref:tripartite tricarboxylate transporter TctB family protein n=1 Tax=Marinobacterium arenosum TaxID=2862496 RepID=UPI001C94CC25|nr:tripartite tricarboxylate transporter TctB family protein [Marinobacterium arenosum]MBY4678462.1 tripartite tricarboxylate transporter TctB family protein [Marinobacterium arenosum]
MTISKDQLGALIFLVLSIAYGYNATLIPLLPGDEFEPINAQSLPIALATLGGIFSFLLLVGSTLSSKRSDDKLVLHGYDFALVGKLLALIVGFALALEWVGFLLATVLFLIGGYWLLGERRPKTLLIASLPFAVGIWFVLAQLLDIYLAPGRLFSALFGG